METSKLITSLNKSGIGAYTELVNGDASIHLSLAEFENKRLIDMPFTFKDMISYLWNPYIAGGPVFSVDDVSVLNDSSTLFVGPPLSHPFKDLKDLKWKLSKNSISGTLDTKYVSNPLFIYSNDIKFYNIFDSSSSFVLGKVKTDIFLEEAYIRDAANNTWDSCTYQYSVYPNIDASFSGYYIMESSLGVKIDFSGYIMLSPNPSTGKMEYAHNNLYNVPLFTFNNFRCIDSSNITHDLSTNYILDIKNGKIRLNDPSNNITDYIVFNYDTSLNEQSIQHDISYESDRIPICIIDPCIYYVQTMPDTSTICNIGSYYYTGMPDASVLVIDNSVYSMKVNHARDYDIEVYGWDGFNNIYYNKTALAHKVWLQTPNIYTITNYDQNIIANVGTVSITDVSNYIYENGSPIYDRIYPMYGLTRENEYSQYYLNIPSVTYFQDLPTPRSINRFYNLTERAISKDGSILTVDINYQSFNIDDSVCIVKYDKGKYDYVDSSIVSVTNVSGNIVTLDSSLGAFNIDASNDIYLINTTFRATSNINGSPDFGEYTIDISNYVFQPSQLINLIVHDTSTDYSWGASYKVYDVSGNTHSIDANVPSMFVNNPRYTISAKHAFTTFSSTDLKTIRATEYYNTFKIYLDDTYNEEWFLDNTFAVVNMIFDQTEVNLNWADGSVNVIDPSAYKKYYNTIVADTNTLLILTAEFDTSTYMKDQKNIWTIRYNTTKDILFRTHNKVVPYRFSEAGYYDVQVESYDSYGNISTINNEGLIHIV